MTKKCNDYEALFFYCNTDDSLFRIFTVDENRAQVSES